MSFLHLEHHGYFHGVARNNQIEYQLGYSVSAQNIWELGNVVNDYANKCTRINLPQAIHLNEFMPTTREDLDAVNNLTLLGPLNTWIQLNPADYLQSINANILSNRGILKNLCLRREGYRFLVRVDEFGRYIFHTEPYENLYEEDLTGFALENFISHGVDEREQFDYREKHYSVQSLKLRQWNIVYNAEYDGFMNIPLWPLRNGNGSRDYNIVRAAPLEMKLFSKNRISDWNIQNWFIQCQLGNIDNLIIGMNPNGRKRDPLLNEIRLFKVQDLPSLRRNEDWSPSQMMRNLDEVLLYLEKNIFTSLLRDREETFRVHVGIGHISHESYQGN